jgi:hypothetical protein
MTDLDKYDDASRDHERFKKELIAKDRDATRIKTDNINETEARKLVADLIEVGVVTPVAEHRVLVRDPTQRHHSNRFGSSHCSTGAGRVLRTSTESGEDAADTVQACVL